MIFAFTRLATRVLPVMLAIPVTNVARICSFSPIIQVLKKHHLSVPFAGFTMLLSMFLFSMKLQMTKVFTTYVIRHFVF